MLYITAPLWQKQVRVRTGVAQHFWASQNLLRLLGVLFQVNLGLIWFGQVWFGFVKTVISKNITLVWFKFGLVWFKFGLAWFKFGLAWFKFG